jgi:hypothetical protein
MRRPSDFPRAKGLEKCTKLARLARKTLESFTTFAKMARLRAPSKRQSRDPCNPKVGCQDLKRKIFAGMLLTRAERRQDLAGRKAAIKTLSRRELRQRRLRSFLQTLLPLFPYVHNFLVKENHDSQHERYNGVSRLYPYFVFVFVVPLGAIGA